LDLEKAVKPEKGDVRTQETFDDGLDDDAIRNYLAEVKRLRCEREQAHELGDLSTVDRLEDEIETIEAQIRREGRSFDAGERARNNVRKALDTVKRKLAKGDRSQKAFSYHVKDMVRTGYKCAYTYPQGEVWH